MLHYAESLKETRKPQNEDVHFDRQTRRGDLCVVLDFATHNFENFEWQLRADIFPLIESLDALEWESPELFLGFVAKELNNYVYRIGQKFCNGQLFCVAAMRLLNGNRMTYLTYGDARINVFDGERLILLNGAKYLTDTIVGEPQSEAPPIDEKPGQFGRKYFDSPLVERAHTLTLRQTDTVLLFTDGVEELLSPPERLAELRRVAMAGPEEILKTIMEATTGVQDDRTLVVIQGPYGVANDPGQEGLSRHFKGLVEDERSSREGDVSTLRQEIDRLNEKVDTKIEWLSQNKADASRLTELIAAQKLQSDSAQLKKSIASGKTKGGRDEREVSQVVDINAIKESFESVVAAHPDWWQRIVTKAGDGAKPAQGKTSAGNSESSPAPKKNAAEQKPQLGTFESYEHEGRLARWLGLWPEPGIGVTRILILLLAGFASAWFITWLRGDVAPQEKWRVKGLSENTLQLTRVVNNAPPQAVELRVGNTLPRGLDSNELMHFGEVVDYLNRTGLMEKPVAVRPDAPREAAVNTSNMNVAYTRKDKIRSGDSLEKIAKRHNISVNQLLEINPDLKNARTLNAGQEINVPDTSANANHQ